MDNNKVPFVSIIIPTRNEEKFIGKCLDSIISSDYPKDKLEILVIDGASKDKTKEIVENYAKKHPIVRFFDNPKGFTPVGLNIGIKQAKGDLIARMDAHASYAKDYLSKCVKYLYEYGADNVGGVMLTFPRKDTLLGKVIAAVLSHRFGVGNAFFRTGAREPMFVDTVFGGCYRREIFEKIGYFNENLPRGQDMELNLRIKKAGGKILLAPDIKSFYYARSDFVSFWRHSFTDGVELVYPLKFGVVIFSWRHLAPLALALSLIFFLLLSFLSFEFFIFFFLILGTYCLASLYFSFEIAFARKDFRYFFLSPIAFSLLHFGYGIGSVWGLLKVFWSKLFS